MDICDRFEKDYRRLQEGALSASEAGALAEHIKVCKHCAAYGPDVDRLRRLLIAQPTYKPSAAFEKQLERRLSGAPGRASVTRIAPRLAPGWAAGAGLATGLAVGFFMMLVPHSTDQVSAPAVAFNATSELAVVADSAQLRNDSTGRDAASYNLDAHSRMVSGH